LLFVTHSRLKGSVLVLALGLAACPRPQRAPPAAPEAVTAAGVAYRIDSVASTVEAHAFRDGPLAALGHNHVLRFPGLSGELVLPRDPTRVHGELSVAVDLVRIDEPDARRAAGSEFAGAVPAEAAAGTREHLLGASQLAALAHPAITASVTGASGGPDDYRLHLRLTVAGVASEQEFPVHVATSPGTLTADGELELSQRALGLTPYSAFLGALAVKDAIVLRYHLVARTAGA
jgi:polyisoprenoid-binding protein YceI